MGRLSLGYWGGQDWIRDLEGAIKKQARLYGKDEIIFAHHVYTTPMILAGKKAGDITSAFYKAIGDASKDSQLVCIPNGAKLNTATKIEGLSNLVKLLID